MRLIDADALIEDIKTKLWDWDTIDGITSSTVLKQTIADIGNAPTIDAVPVVRCRDCRWWNNGKQMCGISISSTPYGHCHDGETWEEAERKDNEID